VKLECAKNLQFAVRRCIGRRGTIWQRAPEPPRGVIAVSGARAEGTHALSPLAVSSIVFAIVFGGVFAGAYLRNALPKHHLEDSAKDVVRLGTGLLATIAGLVLGLLIASANSTYDTQSGQVRRLTADIILLDTFLEQYGPEARPAREFMRRAITPLVERIWRTSGSTSSPLGQFQATAEAESAYAEILKLAPSTDMQRANKARAIEIISDVSQTRLLLFVQADSSIPTPFLAVLVCWLAIIFASFSLFSRLNPTLIAALFVFAWSAAGAIFLILELSKPFSGLLQISSEPLRSALAPL
jgi:hypothetical protein